jgi:chromosome segregation ATPase
MLQKELIQLNEKLQQAEEELIGADPRLGELKRLMEEAEQRRRVADENWVGVHERYTNLYRQIRQKYDKELQDKVKALAEESERKFKQEWAEHETKRREENRLMQQAAEKLTADLRAAIEKYKAALQKTDFFTSPSLNAVRERAMEIAREKAPLIMLLKPTARSLGRAPAVNTAPPSSTPPPTPSPAP